MKTRIALEGVGAALLLLFYYRPLLQRSNLALFHHGLPVNHLIGGFLVDILGVAILASGFLVAVQYLPRSPQRILQALFAGLLLWRIVDFAIQIQTNMWITADWGGVRKQSCIAIVLVSGALASFLPRITEPVVRAVRLVIAAFAFSALWIIPQLMYLAVVRQPDDHAVSLHLPAPTYSGSDRRIIWILFDELSYDQTFDHRFPGIGLPNFDRLRSGSVSFSNLKPAGYYTQRIIPSLFLGRRIDQIRSTPDGDLWYYDESQHRWLAYDPNGTLFGLAQRNGWSSGVDEWTSPYCRILASVLNVCSWEPSIITPMELYGASEEKSVLANAAVLPNALLAMATNRPIAPRDTYRQDFLDILAHAEALIDHSQVRFVFLHLPVPHPPGIYDRRRHLLRSGGTYLDNLVLADDTIGALLQEIDASPSASGTTVIVSSDHSWRIPLYRHAESWSAEEERACGGQFDDRPVLLVHFPRQNSTIDVKDALPELVEHDIIAGMLRGEINNPGDLYQLENKHGGMR
jgi:hypothetical protein